MSKATLIIAFLLVGLNRLPAQQYDTALSKLETHYPEEQVYVHYDKEYYVAGETIWFKAYFYSNGMPSNRSSDFYLQIMDGNGNLISRKQYPQQGATTKGNIELPDSLSQGYYYIRALTKTMLNSNSGSIYSKSLFVFNPVRQRQAIDARKVPGLTIHFFPESGNLVDGIPTLVGFKAVDEDGYPVEVSGSLRAGDDSIITPFRSYHDGMGRVLLIPLAGVKYHAVVDGYESTRFPLPEVKSSGINLSVENEKGGKMFLIGRSEAEKEKFEHLLLVAQINNKIIYENVINFGDFLTVRGHLFTDSLPSGILQFTVFTQSRIPLAERLSFVNNIAEHSGDSISVIRKSGGKGELNTIGIIFPDTIQRSYSVSVTDYPGADFPDRESIYSRLLLTGNINGRVFNPAYYFRNKSDRVSTALDNVMLTHGWSRFNWARILANEFPVKKFNENYLITIKGKVLQEKDKNPVSGGKLNVLLSTEDSLLYSYEAPVNSSGDFFIDSLHITGKTRIFYTYENSMGKVRDVEVITEPGKIEAGIIEMLSALPMQDNSLMVPLDLPGNVIRDQFEFIQAGNPEGKMLENVTINTVKKRPVDILNEKYTSELFRSGGRVIIDNINNKVVERTMNGVEYVRNRINGAGLLNNTFLYRGKFVALFINEMPSDLFHLRNIRADQIAMVKFFHAGFFGGSSEYNGSGVAVYTKKYDDFANDLKKISQYVEYDGYSITKEFYNPDYGKDSKPKITDRRSTLFWNPEAGGDTNSASYQFSFYNNDISSGFRITVEGIDAEGRLIHIEKIITYE